MNKRCLMHVMWAIFAFKPAPSSYCFFLTRLRYKCLQFQSVLTTAQKQHEGEDMNKTRRFLIASFAVCLLVNATAAQQQQTAAREIFLEIFCHRDASSDFQSVPGPNSKLEGGWFGAFGR